MRGGPERRVVKVWENREIEWPKKALTGLTWSFLRRCFTSITFWLSNYHSKKFIIRYGFFFSYIFISDEAKYDSGCSDSQEKNVTKADSNYDQIVPNHKIVVKSTPTPRIFTFYCIFINKYFFELKKLKIFLFSFFEKSQIEMIERKWMQWNIKVARPMFSINWNKVMKIRWTLFSFSWACYSSVQLGRSGSKIWEYDQNVPKLGKKVCHILKYDKLFKLWPIVTKMALSHFSPTNCATGFQIVTNLSFLSQNVTIWAAWFS